MLPFTVVNATYTHAQTHRNASRLDETEITNDNKTKRQTERNALLTFTTSKTINFRFHEITQNKTNERPNEKTEFNSIPTHRMSGSIDFTRIVRDFLMRRPCN